LFELTHRKAQRWLGDVQLLSGAGDIPELDDAREVPQLA
jgi:hypothetical protein